MASKIFISSFGLALLTCSIIAHSSSFIPAAAQAPDQEEVLALCETPNYAIRIYQIGEEPLMRAYNRQNGIVWMNRTPVSVELASEGIRYTNRFGEQTVTTLVYVDAGDCTVQLGNNAPVAGALLQAGATPDSTTSTAAAGQPLENARQLYPAAVASLEAECQTPSSLVVQPFQNRGQPARAQFICWSAPDEDGERVGQWLGNLPLTADDPTFVTAFTCLAGDTVCETQLEELQATVPDILEEAEFACGMKDGRLFLASAADVTDIRCGHFAVTYWDTNGDGSPEHSDAVSVDLSVGQVPL